MSQNSVLYDEDFFAWTVEQARLLRAGEFSGFDVANIAEEIESVGRSDRRRVGKPIDCPSLASSEIAQPA